MVYNSLEDMFWRPKFHSSGSNVVESVLPLKWRTTSLKFATDFRSCAVNKVRSYATVRFDWSKNIMQLGYADDAQDDRKILENRSAPWDMLNLHECHKATADIRWLRFKMAAFKPCTVLHTALGSNFRSFLWLSFIFSHYKLWMTMEKMLDGMKQL